MYNIYFIIGYNLCWHHSDRLNQVACVSYVPDPHVSCTSATPLKFEHPSRDKFLRCSISIWFGKDANLNLPPIFYYSFSNSLPPCHPVGKKKMGSSSLLRQKASVPIPHTSRWFTTTNAQFYLQHIKYMS